MKTNNTNSESSNWIFTIAIAIICLLISGLLQALCAEPLFLPKISKPDDYTIAQYGFWGLCLLFISVLAYAFHKGEVAKKTPITPEKVEPVIDWKKKYDELQKSSNTKISELQAQLKQMGDKLKDKEQIITMLQGTAKGMAGVK